MMDFLIQKVYAYAPGKNPTSGGTAFNALLQKILTNVVNPIIYLIMALAVVYFVWGVMMFIQNADKAEKREEGYKHMIWGIIGIFIMVSAKGIINIIISTMGL
ncbi:MAG: TrbC/VirB2 family protein [bacterium]